MRHDWLYGKLLVEVEAVANGSNASLVLPNGTKFRHVSAGIDKLLGRGDYVWSNFINGTNICVRFEFNYSQKKSPSSIRRRTGRDTWLDKKKSHSKRLSHYNLISRKYL